MNFNTIVIIIILSLALSLCFFGVKQDMDERKFSNKYIAIIIVLGLILAYMLERLKIGLALFVGMNLLGVIMSSLKILSASDWKLFSALCLYIPFERGDFALVYVLVLLICSIIMKIAYTNKGYLKEAFKDELHALQVFFYTRQWLQYDESKGIYKAGTTPATVEIVIAFAVTCIMLI